MFRSFKYRLFTNANQERELAIALETHRRLYNTCLDFKQLAYQMYGVSISHFDQCRWFTHERKINPYFANLNVQSAQATMRRLKRSFDNFFRRVKQGAAKPGYPRFKGRDSFNSFTFPAYPGVKNASGTLRRANGIRLTGNRLYVQHIGTIRVKLHRPVEGTIKTVTLMREAGKWYALFSCDLGDVPITPSVLPAVGIDVGLTHFLTISNGSQEANPRYMKESLPKIRRANRSVSRKKKGGKNRGKARHRLQRIHARVRNQRREHHYRVACRLVLAFGFIAVERLNIQGMLKNDRLSRAISDAGWYGFLDVLRHKAEKAGAKIVEVDPRWTSQQCSKCGKEVKKELSARWHECLHCGLSLHRDHNAALNILARGLVRTAPAGLNVGQ